MDNIKNKRNILIRLNSLFLAGFISLIISVFILIILYQNSYNLYLSIPIEIILFVIFYLFFIRKYIRRKKILRQEFPSEWKDILIDKVAYYNALSEKDKNRFNKRIQVFIAENQITGIETEINDEIRILIAASAIIPVFNFNDWEYNKLSEILVYPSNFDDNFDFTQKKAQILGMVGIGNSMIISKPALYSGFRNPNDKLNVGIHEFVHKLDGEDGLIDGIPELLLTKKLRTKWIKIMKEEMQLLKDGHSDINPYALTNEAEFFAVTSEYFFENPSTMKRKHKELYNILMKIYRQNTFSLYKDVLKSMFKTKVMSL